MRGLLRASEQVRASLNGAVTPSQQRDRCADGRVQRKGQGQCKCLQNEGLRARQAQPSTPVAVARAGSIWANFWGGWGAVVQAGCARADLR